MVSKHILLATKRKMATCSTKSRFTVDEVIADIYADVDSEDNFDIDESGLSFPELDYASQVTNRRHKSCKYFQGYSKRQITTFQQLTIKMLTEPYC